MQFVDQGDAAALAEALAQQPALVWVETPSNPLLRVVDIAAIAEASHAAGAKVAVDNTFLSPLLQQPLALGADLVVHSTTKYINGHSDVVGGVAIAKDPELADSLVWWANCLGLTSGAFDSYLTLRGLRTLAPGCAPIRRTPTASSPSCSSSHWSNASITPACRAIRAMILRAVNSPVSAPC